MDFFSASDPFIRFAASVAEAAAAITVVLVVYILMLRGLRLLGDRRQRKFLKRWRPLVYEALNGSTVQWPRMARGDGETFLWFWNQLHETVRGEAKRILSRIGTDVGVDQVARRFLRSQRISLRLLGIVTLGNLRDLRYWLELLPMAEDAHVPVSLAAAQALLRINPLRSLPELMPLFARRGDWPPTRVLALLQPVDTALVTRAIAAALPKADDAAALRLIEFVAAANPVELQTTMVKRLQRSGNPQLWANVLRRLNDPGHLGLARRCCTHKVWFVRVQAANALGRMGAPEDVGRLIGMLKDAEWWVRYRAAEVLLKLPFLSRAELESRLDRAGADADARAMLEKVATREAA